MVALHLEIRPGRKNSGGLAVYWEWIWLDLRCSFSAQRALGKLLHIVEGASHARRNPVQLKSNRGQVAAV
jgi:hypothetical protein